MYDNYYSQQIYNYLVNNDIAGKLDLITDTLELAIPFIKYILYAVCFFGLLFFGLKFIRFRGVQL